MAEFDSWDEYSGFSHFVMRQARHILDAKNRRFLDTVLETCQKRRRVVENGATLWRAQIGNDWRREDMGDQPFFYEVEEPFSPERMVPLRDRASEGRANPKGIPCLYLSTDMDTAMTETRPWIGSYVSVAQFVVVKKLNVADCSTTESNRHSRHSWDSGHSFGSTDWRGL